MIGIILCFNMYSTDHLETAFLFVKDPIHSLKIYVLGDFCKLQ